MSELQERIRQVRVTKPAASTALIADICGTSANYVKNVLNEEWFGVPAGEVPDCRKCERCGHIRGEVKDSRPHGGYRRRIRECPRCEWRWATYETTLTPLQVSNIDLYSGVLSGLAAPDREFVLRLVRMLASGGRRR